MLVFSVVFVIGTAVFGVNALVHKMQPKPAVSSNGEEYYRQIPGWWYQEYFDFSVCDDDENCGTEADPDHDGLTNQQEFFYNSNPVRAYTVGDSLNDGELVVQGFDPSREGRVLFTEVLTDEGVSEETILEEGLLMESEIEDVIRQSNDISQVQVPLVDEKLLDIAYVDEEQAYRDYMEEMQEMIGKYFPDSRMQDIAQQIEGAQNSAMSGMVADAKSLAAELQTITIPAKLVSFHKYTIAFWTLFADVVIVPGQDMSTSLIDETTNQWFDKAQAFLAVQQRLEFERQLLERL